MTALEAVAAAAQGVYGLEPFEMPANSASHIVRRLRRKRARIEVAELERGFPEELLLACRRWLSEHHRTEFRRFCGERPDGAFEAEHFRWLVRMQRDAASRARTSAASGGRGRGGGVPASNPRDTATPLRAPGHTSDRRPPAGRQSAGASGEDGPRGLFTPRLARPWLCGAVGPCYWVEGARGAPLGGCIVLPRQPRHTDGHIPSLPSLPVVLARRCARRRATARGSRGPGFRLTIRGSVAALGPATSRRGVSVAAEVCAARQWQWSVASCDGVGRERVRGVVP